MVVAGIPGSGKTTLAFDLAEAMEWSVISKDEIKESLMDVLGTGDNEWASTLSRAAHKVMYGVAQTLTGSVILEAHFQTGFAERELEALGRDLIQIYCRCPIDVAWERYRSRRDSPSRHAGHLPGHQDDKATEGWRTKPARPLDLDAPLIEVDTSVPVDLPEVVNRVRETLLHGYGSVT